MRQVIRVRFPDQGGCVWRAVVLLRFAAIGLFLVLAFPHDGASADSSVDGAAVLEQIRAMPLGYDVFFDSGDEPRGLALVTTLTAGITEPSGGTSVHVASFSVLGLHLEGVYESPGRLEGTILHRDDEENLLVQLGNGKIAGPVVPRGLSGKPLFRWSVALFPALTKTHKLVSATREVFDGQSVITLEFVDIGRQSFIGQAKVRIDPDTLRLIAAAFTDAENTEHIDLRYNYGDEIGSNGRSYLMVDSIDLIAAGYNQSKAHIKFANSGLYMANKALITHGLH